MSFSNFARKVRDPAMPYRHRVSALASCVQLYRPIGHHATLSFLQAQAGPFQQDEAALLRALDLIESSRAARYAEFNEYAIMRTQAKKDGQRTPRKADRNPHHVQQWFGAPEQAALYAVSYWKPRLSSLVVAGDSVAENIQRCATACLETKGEFNSEQHALLAANIDHLKQRLQPPAYQSDPAGYSRNKDLLTLAQYIETVKRNHNVYEHSSDFDSKVGIEEFTEFRGQSRQPNRHK